MLVRYISLRPEGETTKCKVPKPIPRWDVHFGVLKTTERTPQLLISSLGPNRVATDSAV